MKRLPVLAFFVAAMVLGGAWPAHAYEQLRVPPGYTLLAGQPLPDGLSHLLLASADPPERVHVAVVPAGAPVAFRTVLSNDAIFEPGQRLEQPSHACARVRCIVAVNGDFFSDEGVPLGGLVSDGQLLRSPNPAHHQLMLDTSGRPSDGTFSWRAAFVTTDLASVSVDAVNTGRGADQIVLYTPAFGPTTKTNRFGVELTLRIVRPAGPLRIGQTVVAEVDAMRRDEGDSPIPPDGVVVSGHGKGADALASVWERIVSGAVGNNVLLRVDTTPDLAESVGGTPILVRDGARWFGDDGSSLVRSRNPRTIVGWTRAGDVLLVTVDGRDPGVSVGMTLAEAADFMIKLGATDAINLDGGGSTSFVVSGRVANRPSDVLVARDGKVVEAERARKGDRVIGPDERGVADVLAVVPLGTTAGGAGMDPLAGALTLPAPRPTLAARRGFDAFGLPIQTGRSWKGDAASVLVSLAAAAAVWSRRRRTGGLPSA